MTQKREYWACFDAGPNGPEWDVQHGDYEQALSACRLELDSGRAKYASLLVQDVADDGTETEVEWRDVWMEAAA